MVLPDPISTYRAVGGKCSSIARWVAEHFAASVVSREVSLNVNDVRCRGTHHPPPLLTYIPSIRSDQSILCYGLYIYIYPSKTGIVQHHPQPKGQKENPNDCTVMLKRKQNSRIQYARASKRSGTKQQPSEKYPVIMKLSVIWSPENHTSTLKVHHVSPE